jgi:hypothetical protein
MKSGNIIALLVVLLCVSFAAPNLTAQEQPAGDEKFSALGFLPSGAGMRMVGAGSTFSVDIYINQYTSDEEAKRLAGILFEGGSGALLKSLEKMDSIGKITLTGRVGFYDLKLIRSHDLGSGKRRIIAVTDRPIQFLEAYGGGRSMDYSFGIMQIDLKLDKKGKKEKGEGALIYAAKVKVIKGNKIEIENYGVSPARLRSVQKF